MCLEKVDSNFMVDAQVFPRNETSTSRGTIWSIILRKKCDDRLPSNATKHGKKFCKTRCRKECDLHGMYHLGRTSLRPLVSSINSPTEGIGADQGPAWPRCVHQIQSRRRNPHKAISTTGPRTSAVQLPGLVTGVGIYYCLGTSVHTGG